MEDMKIGKNLCYIKVIVILEGSYLIILSRSHNENPEKNNDLGKMNFSTASASN